MRTHSWSIPLSVTAALIAQLIASAQQNWGTVDVFALTNGNASARGVAVDAAGRIYVVGTANGHAVVRYSSDGGANWITGDDFIYLSETNNLFTAVTVTAQSEVFVGGSSGIYPNQHWIVRRSTDRGGTWDTVDDYWQPYYDAEPGTNGIVYSLSSDSPGRVYGIGPLIRTHCPCYSTWLVRGSGIGGTNWETKLALASGYGGIMAGTCAGDDVYATGATDHADMADLGLILRSSDQGANWNPVFQGTHDYHRAITADPAGNLYSAGYTWNSTSIVYLVREAAPGGTNWTTLDSSSLEPWFEGLPVADSRYLVPTAIAADAAGNVCVAGQLSSYQVTSNSNGVTYAVIDNWFVRQYSIDTGHWSTTDLSFSTNNTPAVSFGTAFAPDASTFVVGHATAPDGQQQWIVRKSSAPGNRGRRRHGEPGRHGTHP